MLDGIRVLQRNLFRIWTFKFIISSKIAGITMACSALTMLKMMSVNCQHYTNLFWSRYLRARQKSSWPVSGCRSRDNVGALRHTWHCHTEACDVICSDGGYDGRPSVGSRRNRLRNVTGAICVTGTWAMWCAYPRQYITRSHPLLTS